MSVYNTSSSTRRSQQAHHTLHASSSCPVTKLSFYWMISYIHTFVFVIYICFFYIHICKYVYRKCLYVGYIIIITIMRLSFLGSFLLHPAYGWGGRLILHICAVCFFYTFIFAWRELGAMTLSKWKWKFLLTLESMLAFF